MKSRQGRIVGLAVATLMLVMPATGQAAPISGSWSGDVLDEGSSDPYKAKLKIKDMLKRGEKGGESYYPKFDCGGNLILQRRTKSGSFIFEERLTEGVENCIDGGKMKLTPQGKSLLYRWTHEEGAEATGKLKRPNA